MQGLMSQYPLTLTHVFSRAERLFPDKGVATVTAGGIDRITYREWAERTRKLASVLDTLGISEDGRVATSSSTSPRRAAAGYCTRSTSACSRMTSSISPITLRTRSSSWTDRC